MRHTLSVYPETGDERGKASPGCRLSGTCLATDRLSLQSFQLPGLLKAASRGTSLGIGQEAWVGVRLPCLYTVTSGKSLSPLDTGS